LRTVSIAVLLGTVGAAIPFALRDLNCRFSNMDIVADRLAREADPNDYIVVTPWHFGISFSRYYHGPAKWDTLPPIADHTSYRFDLLPKTATEKDQAEQPVLDRIQQTLHDGHRIWVVGWMSVPPQGKTAASTEARFIAAHSQEFKVIDLKLPGATSDYEDVSLLQATGWKSTVP